MVEIRVARASDAAILTELGARTFRDTYSADTHSDDMKAFIASHYRHDLQAAELEDPSYLYLVAESERVPAGFALLRDGPRARGVVGKHPLMLAQLYVDRPFLGIGVGTSLLDCCLEEARLRGHDMLWLGVWERNLRARLSTSAEALPKLGR